MKQLAIYLREKFADVGEEITATLEPFMSDREPNEPLVLNLNQGEDNGES
jgi:hypothetical protein|tara:strand:+ start:22 stop:171 length:150 start_codon:yes stop_codon:yes gene_type:complete